ncbi:MAG: pilus assembly protein [Actinobacteria bacterium]|nr:pilus assembly protein [Actinomycetota bacterium]
MVLVEFVLIVPFLAIMAFGLLEFTVALQRTSSTLDASRAGARVASSLGNDPTADFYALDSLRSTLSSQGLLPSVTRMVIYQAASPTAPPPSTCLAPSPSGKCDVFTAAQVKTDTAFAFDGTTGCPKAGFGYAGWCPNARIDTQTNADWVGIWVEVKPSFYTKFFGSIYTISRSTVMRVEPSPQGA